MPDHFHGVIFVEELMDVSVGAIVRAFKVSCTQRWRALTGQPSLADNEKPTTSDGRPLAI